MRKHRSQGCRPRDGVSALSLQRTLEISSYQTAWAMLHRLRAVLVRRDRELLSGTVEVDETFIGGQEPAVTGRLVDMSIAESKTKTVRRAVVWYSIRNRLAKAKVISAWMNEHACNTVLFVGALGRESGDANAGIVEREVAVARTVKMAINVVPIDTDYPFMVADGRQMPFEDDYVDFALANAIIEHVGDEFDQRRFIAEQTRVARCWVVTTPNRWFPVESHTATLFLHWLPTWRRKRREFTRLLSRREFEALLPKGATMTGHWWSPTFTAYFSKDADA